MKRILGIVFLLGFAFLYLFYEKNRTESSKPYSVQLKELINSYNDGRYLVQGEHAKWKPHKLAVIIPFRDAFEELIQLVPALDDFLNKQLVQHEFIVIHQVDTYRFNKGSLVNIGYLLSKTGCDYLAIHDVDLIPLNPNLSYAYPDKGPFHVASPDYHPFYHGSTYSGGIILLTMEQYKKVNGMTNNDWGWGGEDNELYSRMMKENMIIHRPSNLSTGVRDTFKNLHNARKRPRDMKRFNMEKKDVFKIDRNSGFHNVKYRLVSTVEMMISKVPVTVHNVRLFCDESVTKWCLYDAR